MRAQRDSDVLGSLPKAMAFFGSLWTTDTRSGRGAGGRIVSLRAASRLRKRVPFAHLSARLQRDFRSFFGSYPEAERQATDAMLRQATSMSLSSRAATSGLGGSTLWNGNTRCIAVLWTSCP